MKLFSEACERNKEPILKILKLYVNNLEGNLLEVGSGTGQHADFFTKQLPNIQWYASDLENRHDSIKAYKKESGQNNFHGPLLMDLNAPTTMEHSFRYVFSANVVHIVSPKLVENFFRLSGRTLEKEGILFLYGPFNIEGKYTSSSNQSFDLHLKSNVSPESGIRDLEWIISLAGKQDIELLEKHEMPANNFCLVFQKKS